MTKPTHGYTDKGHAVHGRVIDHHPVDTRYQRFNKRVALFIVTHVGTMTCFWIFCCLALCSFPAVLNEFAVFKGVFPSWLVTTSIIALVSWIAQSFLQLILLPSIIVGQNLQSAAADARAAKTFEQTTDILDRLDTRTQGGITEVLEAVRGLSSSHPSTSDKTSDAKSEHTASPAPSRSRRKPRTSR